MKSQFFIGIATALFISSSSVIAQDTPRKVEIANSRFSLVKLPYESDELSPVISKQTIDLHHGKHLQGYINNVNKLIQGSQWEQADLVTIVKESEGALFNNAGQVLNHNLYFLQFRPNPKDKIPRYLAKLITARWGSFSAFQNEFEQAGSRLFGSGWLWLSQDEKGDLQISLHAGGDNPVTKGWTPLLGVDLWEHAYYLDYQNRRGDHIKSLWKIIDWEVVANRLRTKP